MIFGLIGFLGFDLNHFGKRKIKNEKTIVDEMMMRTFVVEKTKSILILIAFIITISNAIIQLDPTSFAKEQQSERILLILMHDGNLERLKPLVDNFVKAESLLQLKGVSSGTFDCSAFPDFATDLAIDRLPVILAFRFEKEK